MPIGGAINKEIVNRLLSVTLKPRVPCSPFG